MIPGYILSFLESSKIFTQNVNGKVDIVHNDIYSLLAIESFRGK
jgi:hypothetical protein